jgi:hypothetical protein
MAQDEAERPPDDAAALSQPENMAGIGCLLAKNLYLPFNAGERHCDKVIIEPVRPSGFIPCAIVLAAVTAC